MIEINPVTFLNILKWTFLFILFLPPNNKHVKGQWNYFNDWIFLWSSKYILPPLIARNCVSCFGRCKYKLEPDSSKCLLQCGIFIIYKGHIINCFLIKSLFSHLFTCLVHLWLEKIDIYEPIPYSLYKPLRKWILISKVPKDVFIIHDRI